MQHYTSSVIDTFGNAISGATINVYAAGTTTPSTIYSDNIGTTTSNPLTSGADGSFDFYAPSGRYDLVITHPGHTFTAADTAGIALYDQQVGTWTPELTFTTPGDLTVIYSGGSSGHVGSYIKAGRSVTVWFAIVTSTFTHTTASGSFRITGLPFPASDGGVAYFGSLTFRGITKASYTQFTPFVPNEQSEINLYASGSAQSESVLSTTDVPTGGTVKMFGSVTYDAGAASL